MGVRGFYGFYGCPWVFRSNARVIPGGRRREFRAIGAWHHLPPSGTRSGCSRRRHRERNNASPALTVRLHLILQRHQPFAQIVVPKHISIASYSASFLLPWSLESWGKYESSRTSQFPRMRHNRLISARFGVQCITGNNRGNNIFPIYLRLLHLCWRKYRLKENHNLRWRKRERLYWPVILDFLGVRQLFEPFPFQHYVLDHANILKQESFARPKYECDRLSKSTRLW